MSAGHIIVKIGRVVMLKPLPGDIGVGIEGLEDMAKLAPKGAFMDNVLAHRYGCMMAAGLPEDLVKLRASSIRPGFPLE